MGTYGRSDMEIDMGTGMGTDKEGADTAIGLDFLWYWDCMRMEVVADMWTTMGSDMGMDMHGNGFARGQIWARHGDWHEDRYGD